MPGPREAIRPLRRGPRSSAPLQVVIARAAKSSACSTEGPLVPAGHYITNYIGAGIDKRRFGGRTNCAFLCYQLKCNIHASRLADVELNARLGITREVNRLYLQCIFANRY